ncbi:MAG: hypothetical protein OJF52_002125 [Nitrospira sp.]|jgi:hypothetical protein|nr:MAG: hypothetical protein OJF52_002125 [Nitrospira sp.]
MMVGVIGIQGASAFLISASGSLASSMIRLCADRQLGIRRVLRSRLHRLYECVLLFRRGHDDNISTRRLRDALG